MPRVICLASHVTRSSTVLAKMEQSTLRKLFTALYRKKLLFVFFVRFTIVLRNSIYGMLTKPCDYSEIFEFV